MALNCISTRKPHAEPSRSHDCVQATAGPLRDDYVNTTRNHDPGFTDAKGKRVSVYGVVTQSLHQGGASADVPLLDVGDVDVDVGLV